MRYIRKYDDLINEGILSMFNSLFKGVKKMYTNIKGGKKLEEILNKYTNQIDVLFDKLINANSTKSASKLTEALDDDPTNTETDNRETNDTANLDKQNLKSLITQIKKQIEILKTRFNKEVDMYIKKNSTDKLEELSFLTKNQFEDHVYSKYEETFKKSNDEKNLKSIVKLRNKMKQQMSEDIKKINADKSVNATEKNNSSINIKLDGNYIYTNNDNKKVYINVIEINKDKDGKENTLLAKVKNKEGNEFYVLKNKLAVIKVGDKYNYTNKENKTSEVEIVEVDDNGNISKVKNEDGNEFDPIDSNIG